MKNLKRQMTVLAMFGFVPALAMAGDGMYAQDLEHEITPRVQVIALNSDQIAQLQHERDRHQQALEQLENEHRSKLDSILGEDQD